MVNKIKPRLKKLLSTFLLIIGLWTIASATIVAFPPDVREQVKVFTVPGAIDLLAEKVDELSGRVGKLELETARDRACQDSKDLVRMPADPPIIMPGKSPFEDTVPAWIDLFKRMYSEEDERYGNIAYGSSSGKTGYVWDAGAQGTKDVNDYIATLEQRYQDYLTAKEECERLTEEFNQKYGD